MEYLADPEEVQDDCGSVYASGSSLLLSSQPVYDPKPQYPTTIQDTQSNTASLVINSSAKEAEEGSLILHVTEITVKLILDCSIERARNQIIKSSNKTSESTLLSMKNYITTDECCSIAKDYVVTNDSHMSSTTSSLSHHNTANCITFESFQSIENAEHIANLSIANNNNNIRTSLVQPKEIKRPPWGYHHPPMKLPGSSYHPQVILRKRSTVTTAFELPSSDPSYINFSDNKSLSITAYDKYNIANRYNTDKIFKATIIKSSNQLKPTPPLSSPPSESIGVNVKKHRQRALERSLVTDFKALSQNQPKLSGLSVPAIELIKDAYHIAKEPLPSVTSDSTKSQTQTPMTLYIPSYHQNLCHTNYPDAFNSTQSESRSYHQSSIGHSPRRERCKYPPSYGFNSDSGNDVRAPRYPHVRPGETFNTVLSGPWKNKSVRVSTGHKQYSFNGAAQPQSDSYWLQQIIDSRESRVLECLDLSLGRNKN